MTVREKLLEGGTGTERTPAYIFELVAEESRAL